MFNLMEILYTAIAVVSSVIISLHTWKFLKWAWFDPKKQEKQLRQQGFNGSSYRFLIGDYKDMTRKEKQVMANPIPFNNDIAERTMGFYYEAIQKYGEHSFIWFGPTPTVMISDPELIKEILTKNYVFQKMVSPLSKLIAEGVAMYETDKWAKHRRLINPAFHLEKLKTMLPAFHQTSSEMLSKWEKKAPKEGSWEIDVWPYLQTLTSDAISRTAFGSNYEEGRKIFELQTELGTLLLKNTKAFLIPGWRFLPTKANRRMKEIAKEVESSILGITDKRMKMIEAGETNSDLLGILLESNFKEIQENGNQCGMSFKDVIEECKLFYIAGQTTTASLLVWTMVLLGKHVDWQARARDEVRQVFWDNNLLDFQKLSHLKVITMIFNEVLRLYPPGIILGRMVHTETKLKGITLPAGVQVFLPTILLHNDINAWGTDAKEFNPERFSEGISKATKEQYSYFPFGGGPRICIGQAFAMLEAKMALSMILQRYTFEVSPSYAHAPTLEMTLLPQYGAQLMFSKI